MNIITAFFATNSYVKANKGERTNEKDGAQ